MVAQEKQVEALKVEALMLLQECFRAWREEYVLQVCRSKYGAKRKKRQDSNNSRRRKLLPQCIHEPSPGGRHARCDKPRTRKCRGASSLHLPGKSSSATGSKDKLDSGSPNPEP